MVMLCGTEYRHGSYRARILSVVTAVLLWAGLSLGARAEASGQEAFKAPEAAVDALAAAARANGTAELMRILGPQSKELVSSGDKVADKNARDRFVSAFDVRHKLVHEGADKAMLLIGKDQWPFPIPLVRKSGMWHFDTGAGLQEILDRRIGRNELSAIEVCRAYVDAQREYASVDRNGDGILEYAQHFLSHTGQHDGLFWETQPGEPESPMGELVAEARAEGYPAARGQGRRTPYHGYYYRILKRQGANAEGGAYSYIADGHMIGGFALVAFPAQYGASGIMTFLVNQDGVVYQRDLGPHTASIARHMTTYDPDAGWHPAKPAPAASR